MPGTYMIDNSRTFSTMILMSSGPRLAYGTQDQEITQNGEKRWVAELACSHHPAVPGQRAISEVISVTITGPPSDPGASIPQGSAVEMVDLRMGIMAPEQGERGIRGGKPYFAASGIRAVNGRPAGKDG